MNRADDVLRRPRSVRQLHFPQQEAPAIAAGYPDPIGIDPRDPSRGPVAGDIEQLRPPDSHPIRAEPGERSGIGPRLRPDEIMDPRGGLAPVDLPVLRAPLAAPGCAVLPLRLRGRRPGD